MKLAWRTVAVVAMATGIAWLQGCSATPQAPATTAPGARSASAEAAPLPAPCPSGVPAGARCLRGRDSAQAPYLIVVPQAWNGVLVLHAHGGPALGEPQESRSDEDIQRWAITVRAGYAWAGSVFRQGGVAVTSAAQDTKRVRQIFLQHVAVPRLTVLHGQSWGAGVAARAAELATAAGGKPAYDAVLLSSGVLGGGAQSYEFRLDLRVVYQYLCANHPRADEPPYPLWQGLPAGSPLTRAELAARANACLGLAVPAAARTPEQARRLKTIVDVIGIPETSVLAHLNWATWHFQDIAFKRTGGRNAFGNDGVRYRGSDDDAALNAGVLRYAADPQAAAQFAADAGLAGRIGVPVITVHGIGDATAFVELESAFRDTMTRGGSAGRLVQTFTRDAEHSYLSDPVYPALLAALVQWVETGDKPTPAALAQRCEELQKQWGPGCRFVTDYQSAPLASRVAPR